MPEKSHGQRSLVGCSPWGRKESDTTVAMSGLRLIYSSPGACAVGRCFRREPWFSRRLETVRGAGRHMPHSSCIACVDVHGFPDREMPTHAHLPPSPFKGHFQSILRIRKRGFPGGSEGNASACNAGGLGSIPGLGRSPGERNGNPLQYTISSNMPGESHGQRSLAGYSPWGCKESDIIE